jgi:hypothetical protein
MSKSTENLKLAETVKSVHRKLRQEVKNGFDAETVWEQHCKDKNTLKVYLFKFMFLFVIYILSRAFYWPGICRIDASSSHRALGKVNGY